MFPPGFAAMRPAAAENRRRGCGNKLYTGRSESGGVKNKLYIVNVKTHDGGAVLVFDMQVFPSACGIPRALNAILNSNIMDKLKHFWTLLFVASALCACDPSDPEAGDEVRILGGNSFTVEAGDTAVNGGAPIAFVADGEWNASPVGEASEWLTVTPESGAAGAGEITIACQPNTGSQRDGRVRIVCGEGAAEIAIRQKGAGDPGNDPDVPGPDPVTPLKGQVSRIVFETISESGDFGELGKEDWTCDFTYDEENRIAGIDIEDIVEEGCDVWTYPESYRFDRSEPGKIAFIHTFRESDYEDWSSAGDLTLDDAGRVSRWDMQGDGAHVAIASYDEDGHLLSVVKEFDVYREEYHYSWNGGLLATIAARGSEDSIGRAREWSEFEDFTGRYGDLPNGAMNIDPNIFLMSDPGGSIVTVMLMLRMMGASSDRLLALSNPMLSYSPAVSCPSGLPKPNMTEHCSTEVSYENYDTNIYYDADPDGLVRSITRYRADVVALGEYDIVSGDELVNPEYPELGYAICDVSEVTLKDIISSQRNGTREVCTFEYRTN